MNTETAMKRRDQRLRKRLLQVLDAAKIRPATALPFFKHGTEGGQDLSVGVVPEHSSPHFMKEPISGVSGVQVLQNLPSYILRFE